MHDLHNKYSLAGEKIEVTSEMLSDYQLKIIEGNNCFLAKKRNIIPNLGNKRKYKLRYQNLKNFIEV